MSRSSPSVPAPGRAAALAGAGFVALSAVGFSAKAIMVKLAYGYTADATTVLALRMGFSVPFFIGMALWSGRQGQAPLERRDWMAVAGLGMLGYYLASFLDLLGLQLISASLERLILFLYPTMVVLLSALFFRQPIGRREVVALALSYGGIGLVFASDASFRQGGVGPGALLVFGSALAYAFYLLGSGRVIPRVGAMRFTAYAMSAACGMSVVQFAVTRPLSALQVSPHVYGLTAAMAVFSTVLPSSLLAIGIRRIGASRAALVGTIGPVATIVLAYFILGEAISALQLLGAALVLAGVLVVSLKSQK